MVIMTGRMVTVTRRMMERSLVTEPQQVLETTVPLFSLRSGLSISFYLR